MQSNESVLEELNVKRTFMRVIFGHVVREDNIIIPILQGMVAGTRRGRSQKRWIDGVPAWTDGFHYHIHRSARKQLVHNVSIVLNLQAYGSDKVRGDDKFFLHEYPLSHINRSAFIFNSTCIFHCKIGYSTECV